MTRSSFPPALHAALQVPGGTAPAITSVMSELMKRANCNPVLIPASATAREAGTERFFLRFAVAALPFSFGFVSIAVFFLDDICVSPKSFGIHQNITNVYHLAYLATWIQKRIAPRDGCL